ncbi:MAG: RNA-binding S4 domain-containing protein [Muribaculaceae bacterium]|jgi:ribosome-associated heat shock protein Hsp15|nr:RNA-binding S4 domain-containing protein [Muribaculaceae bacterium]
MPKEEVRIDKWLWATRIFKTRSIATEMCKMGRVTIEGMNVKPSRMIKIGETISVRKPPVTYSFQVIGLVENRVGAKMVPNYLKNVTDPKQFEILEMARIGGFVKRQKGLGRPTKKEGREIARFTEEAFFGFDDDDEPLDDDNDV